MALFMGLQGSNMGKKTSKQVKLVKQGEPEIKVKPLNDIAKS